MFRLSTVCLLALAACGGSTTTPDAAKTADAAKADAPKVDAKPAGSGAAFGSACTTPNDTGSDSASCTGNDECQSGCCTSSFNQLGNVCSDPCTMLNDGSDTAECPDGSMGSKCNQKGYCRP
jgi:hypothetical protein